MSDKELITHTASLHGFTLDAIRSKHRTPKLVLARKQCALALRSKGYKLEYIAYLLNMSINGAATTIKNANTRHKRYKSYAATY
jgi:hypothetical protein